MFRKTKKVEEILELGSEQLKIILDKDLVVEGWEEYEISSRKTRDLYSSHLQSLMDTYGIADEASLVCSLYFQQVGSLFWAIRWDSSGHKKLRNLEFCDRCYVSLAS